MLNIKTIESLRETLKKGLSIEEDKVQFIKDLQLLSAQIQEDTAGRSVHAGQKTKDDLVTFLLFVCSTHDDTNILQTATNRVWSEEQRSIIEVIADDLGSTKNRSGIKRRREVDDEGADFDEDDYPSPAKKQKTAQIVANNGNWKKNQLTALKKSLLSFGFGRWEKIGLDSELTGKTVIETNTNPEGKERKSKAYEFKTIDEIQSLSENIVTNMFAIGKPEQEGLPPKYCPEAYLDRKGPLNVFLGDTQKSIRNSFADYLNETETASSKKDHPKGEHCAALVLADPQVCFHIFHASLR